MNKRLKALLEQKAGLIAEGREILDKASETEAGDPTAEQNERLDAIDSEVDKLNASIGREQKQLERERESGSALFEGEDPSDTTALSPPTATAAKPFRSFGEQLQAIAAAAPQGAVPDPRLLVIQDAAREQAAAQGASEGVPSDGGWLVQTDFMQGVLEGIMAGGEILRRVRPIPISAGSNGIKINGIDETSRADGSRWGGIRGYFAAEAATATKSKPKFKQIELNPHKTLRAQQPPGADASAISSSVA